MARPIAPLLGRQSELARLHALAAAAATGTPAFVLVIGDGGIGKTALVETFLAEQGAAGAAIVSGGCPPGSDGSMPYAPIAQGLRDLARQLGPVVTEDLIGPYRPDLARIAPSLGTPDPRPTFEQGQSRLNEAILSLLERLAEAQPPAILAIEDIQWIDRSTTELLSFLVRAMSHAGVLVVATYRSDELPAGHPLRRRLAELERTGRIERLELAPLDDAAIETIVRSAAPGLAPAGVRGLVARSSGNPFFAEVLATAASSGSATLPSTLRELALDHVDALSAAARRVVDVAAVAGGPISIDILERAVDGGAAAAVREATAALVLVREPAGDRYGFRHGLVREAVLGELHDTERRALHRRLATLLETTADDPAVAARELATHWLGAGEPSAARPWLLRAAGEAERAFAFAEAHAAYEAALAIEATGSSIRVDDIRRHAADAALLADEPAAALAHAAAVAEADATSAAAGTMTQALDLERLARAAAASGDPVRALEAAETAVALSAALMPDAAALRIRATYARQLIDSGRASDAMAACETALAAVAPVSADATARGEIARLESARAIAASALGDPQTGIAVLAEARAALARSWSGTSGIRPRPSRIGDVIGSVSDLAAILARAGHVDEAATVAAEGGELARRLGVRDTLGRKLDALTATWLFHRGRWEDADRVTRALLDGGARGEPAVRLCLVRARLELARGSFADAELQLEAAAVHGNSGARPGLLAELQAVRAELAIVLGRAAQCRDEVASGLLLLDVEPGPAGRAELVWLGLRAEADRAVDAGARRAPAEQAEARDIASGLVAEMRAIEAAGDAVPARERAGFTLLAQAERGRLDGDDDAEAWARAAASWDGLGEPYPAAYARLREATALLETRGSRVRAQEAARAAFETARRLDAAPLRRDLGLLAQRGRLALESDVSPVVAVDPRTSALRESGLTSRELEVLTLIARGYTNRQIADALFITEKTAGHHVSNLLGKLGVASRVEAAGRAHRLGLLDEDGPSLA